MSDYDPSGMHPAVALLVLVAAIFALFYGVLSLLAPFFWYGAWKRAKEISLKMDTLIELTRVRRDPNL
jgi:cation transport ATPase